MSEESGLDELTRAWDERTDVIRSFIEARPQYEQLCDEVEYILRKKIGGIGIEYSAITSRAKTLKSFAEKLSRKEYDDPLTEVTDLAGVRVVYLYKSDRISIENIIESEFTVVEKVDKVEEQDTDRFGYGALHYLVHLGRESSGARYDDLKELVCEIQVRTVLQDAWAIIDHHLSYKQESDVPRILRRKLNSLSGLVETADDQFDSVKNEREAYKISVKTNLAGDEAFLNQEANLDNLFEFLVSRFPDKALDPNESGLSRLLNSAAGYGYKTLLDLDGVLKRTEKARAAMDKELDTQIARGELARAIALEHPAYRKEATWKPGSDERFARYEHLIQRPRERASSKKSSKPKKDQPLNQPRSGGRN